MALFCYHHPRPKHHYLFYHFLTTFTTFTFLFFSSTSAFTTLTPQPSAQAVNKQPLQRDDNKNGIVVVADEKRFGRPGSWPPSCRSKCGWCNPCHPVHVPVQLGLIIRLEYYPEAWRCKCGNKFFMP
ncbi:unnamed protein product [Lupinus luteus]|uniref:Epidermal patterning factor-like protein n=1 Tax=Lupinus luteus TaxID=3873 RepID=A0AAV1X4V6_LUPLU